MWLSLSAVMLSLTVSLGHAAECNKPNSNQCRADIIRPGWSLGQDPLPANSERLMPQQKLLLWLNEKDQYPDPLPLREDALIVDAEHYANVQTAVTVKLSDSVAPVPFSSGDIEIDDAQIQQLRSVLAGMQDRQNLRLHFIGHTDNAPLSSAGRVRYGDNYGLSAARAKRVAEFFQRELDLPPAAVSFEGRGADQPLADNLAVTGRALNRRVEIEIWYDEIPAQPVQELAETSLLATDVRQIKVCRLVKRCIYRRRVGQFQKIQLLNAVPPLRYNGTQISVTPADLELVRRALAEVQAMPNVTLRVIGHTDNQPLTDAAERIYLNNINLSQALANRVARVLQQEFQLSNNAISAYGKGETAPVASNATPSGRALNRRIDIEIWHDDPRQQTADLPQACPGNAAGEMITVTYTDETPVIPFKTGQPVYPNGFDARVRRILTELQDKANVRINIVGHTSNERLSRRAASVYRDHFGLSAARAETVKQQLMQQLSLSEQQLLIEGRGFLQPLHKPDDSPFAPKNFALNNAAAAQTVNPADARVELEFLYDELAEIEIDPNVDILPLQQEEPPATPYALHPIRVTVDGDTLDDSRRHSADVQRCTDVALERAAINMRYDNLRNTPRLNLTATPVTVTSWDDPATDVMENKVSFQAYTNYAAFIDKAEVRIFTAEQSLTAEPLAIIPLNQDWFAEWWWLPELEAFAGPVKELRYLLRVYDKNNRYDETAAKPLWLVHQLKDAQQLIDMDFAAEQRIGYGETSLAKQNIPLRGGTVAIDGAAIPEDYAVWVLNQAVPLSDSGEFVVEQILPNGAHSLEVAVLDESGSGNLYLRDAELRANDWFYVGIADLTLGFDDTNGPAELVTQDTTHYDNDVWLDGRLAFYAKGKTQRDWTITASADSREEPLDELFSNLDEKNPDAVFRRLDPDYHYPTLGDDSTTVEDAPTSGKFYVKAEKHKSYAMWGNFETHLLDTDLAQIDRVLYGANGHYESMDMTEYGDTKTTADVFIAEPGTILARDEFRGTGGSLYFLQRRDVTQGSERLRIEIRDKDSDIVLEARNLVYAQDYDIDYIQGRVLLNKPLPSTVDDGLLVQSNSLSGNPVYLVVRYEYTPGFDALDDVSIGGRAARWFGDSIKLGATFSSQEQLSDEQTLGGIDVTWRRTAGSYLKIETATTDGPGVGQTFSGDGGFEFDSVASTDPDLSASAYRLEAVAALDDFFANAAGQLSFYHQQREAGFAAPGQLTNHDITQTGAAVTVPVAQQWVFYGKIDERDQDQGLVTTAVEVDTRYRLNQQWQLSWGVRVDEREDNSSVVPNTQTVGRRSDLAFAAAYDSFAAWTLYGFVQNTLESTDSRPDNNRTGVGSRYQLTDRALLDGEISGGDGGVAGRIGMDYLVTDRTNVYFSYAIDPDRSDTGLRSRNGQATLGFRSRYTDTISVFGEERFSFGDQPVGLTHAYGIDIAPFDHWTIGMTIEAGTLEDRQTGAETERLAFGVSAGYGGAVLKYATALEWREDSTEVSERQTYLLRNNLAVELNPSWRTIAKLNLAISEHSDGEFFDGDFTEFVLGYAYRPIHHDRLNLLFKYTFFENLPSAEQLGSTGTRADFQQRSHILAVDGSYNLSKRWTVGAKLARRTGEVALDRVNPQFFESNANLYIVRADWHLVRGWDVLVEARLLEVEEAQDERSGFLTAGYKHLGQNLKVGAGYNFTDFSDDLTDLDYDSQGVFINAVGKF